MSVRSARRAHEIHVYKGAGSVWVVTSGRRTLSRHWTERTAATRGARVARRRRVDLVIQGLDGRLRSKDSHGNESSRPDREH